MKSTLLTILCFLACLSVKALSVDEVPNVHLEDRTQYVSNPDGVLSPATVAKLNSQLGDIWRTTSAEPVVVALDNIPDDIDYNDYATELFEKWGLGKGDKDNGVLVLLILDLHQVVIRTGRGVEGVLPDILCGRIIRNVMLPYFREGNYDKGMIEGVSAMKQVIVSPESKDELMSRYANDAMARRSRGQSSDDEDLGLDIAVALGIGVVLTIICFIVLMFKFHSTRKMEPTPRYQSLESLKVMILVCSVFGLGLPLLTYWMLTRKLKKLRFVTRTCPNCHAQMQRLDEETDNLYLTPAQDTEERLNSVDYDVWLCPECNETDIIPYVNTDSSYTVCPKCGSRAVQPAEERIIEQPTTRKTGTGVRTTICHNCGNRTEKRYTIPVKEDGTAVALSILGAMMSSGGGGGRGGGGFSGGSFGGGHTGGGGASGSW